MQGDIAVRVCGEALVEFDGNAPENQLATFGKPVCVVTLTYS